MHVYKILSVTLFVFISGCASTFQQDRSNALYAALTQVPPGCDLNASCIEKWDIARLWLNENSLPSSTADTKSLENFFALSKDRSGTVNDTIAFPSLEQRR